MKQKLEDIGFVFHVGDKAKCIKSDEWIVNPENPHPSQRNCYPEYGKTYHVRAIGKTQLANGECLQCIQLEEFPSDDDIYTARRFLKIE